MTDAGLKEDKTPEQVLDKALQKYTLHVLPTYLNKELRREQLEEQLEKNISDMLDVALFQCWSKKHID